ncbi:MAG: quinol:cytochrome C oxidoreductase [Sphingobacteriales bacterium]|nr:quinol:cytochrome C oxidoreductase [Sphingobacteriales bacterium]MBI3718192.1 quinol:cytochrome C oxidoreductase [Sphingobacteriales bacterium]
MIKEQFEITGRYKQWAYALIGVGVLALVLGFVFLNVAGDANSFGVTKYWAVLMHNSIYFLLVAVAAMFFISATTMAMGGWQTSMRRVPEAISGYVYVGGAIALVILLGYVFGSQNTAIYHWKDAEHVAHDKVLTWKKGFLNPTFFSIATILVIGIWMALSYWYRKVSLAEDAGAPGDRSYFWKTIIICAAFIVVYGLTVGSTTPWLWLMSIDAHWFSTMYSWYTFASSWVAGLSLIMLFIVYLKNQGYLEYVNEEHIHDVGKFIFAFSIFWTYLWFSQYMLIWYSNQPEETVYFQPRLHGAYQGIFYLNLIINFVAPILILMKRSSKRNYATVTFMSVVLIFGHWLDFYQMIMPGSLKGDVNDGNSIGLFIFDMGVAAGFIGLIMLIVGNKLTKASLLPKNHPFVKESIVHHT